MSANTSSVAIFALALLLGLRHGIDWDHIAAITDVTGTSTGRKNAFVLSFLYIFGHALMVIILGLIAILIGVNLPDWVDPFMEKFVGITLIILGLWLLFSIFRHGKNFRLKSRWLLIFDLINRVSLFLHNKIPHRHEHQQMRADYGKNSLRAAFIIGAIHGVGAETPTQVLLFITAAGMTQTLFGALLLLTFVAGLATSNTLISILAIFGYAKAKENSSLFLVLGLLTGVFSLLVGSLLLFNKSYYLPAILGG